MTTATSARIFLATTLLLIFPLYFAGPSANAQDIPSERQLRTYIPPDQLVSFHPSTPFNAFIEQINPTFRDHMNRTVIVPFSKTEPIGITISGMYYRDALDLLLEYHGLRYRDTGEYLIVEEAPEEADLPVGERARQVEQAEPADLLARVDDRDIEINAVLFELNQTRARQLGMDWNVLFGDQAQTGTGTGSQQNEFSLRTGELFQELNDYYIAPPATLPFSQLTQLFRLLETEGLGETIAQPSVTVSSGDQGRIQVGSDIPVQVRDFAGNTITQFVSTGIIVDVTPTLLTQPVADTLGAPTLDFIHLDVQVERSSGRPFGGSIAVDRSTADTRVLMLDDEQTIIGGLYSTDISQTRRGIPLLKDLPGWFFGLRYVFGFEQNELIQRELVIVLNATVRENLVTRAGQPIDVNLLEQRRREVHETILRFDEQTGGVTRSMEPQALPEN